jgi:DNA-binding SARP family transcriptional activator
MIMPGLMVRVIGGLAVTRGSRELRLSDVGSRKARTLLALLAVHRGFVTSDPITVALWGDRPPRNPAANIATLVSRLRATLGTHVIIGAASGYRLGDEVRVDLADAALLIDESELRLASQQAGDALVAALRALRLLDRGEVLPLETPSWTTPARTLHGELQRRARHATADAALRIGDVTTAATAAEAAVSVDVYDESACRMLMRAHHAAGAPDRALAVYHQLRTTLAAELGVDPALATRNLHVAIQQGGAEPAMALQPGWTHSSHDAVSEMGRAAC